MTPSIRNIGSGVTNITTTDNVLNIDTTLGAATLTLPSIASWFELKNKSGAIYDADGLRFTDVGGVAAINNITFNTSSGDLINSDSSIVISTNGASGILTPNLDNGTWEFSLVGAGSGSGGGLYDVFRTIILDNIFEHVLQFDGVENIYPPNNSGSQGYAIIIGSLNSEIESISFPNLTNVYGRILFADESFNYGNPLLTQINMPSLVKVTDIFAIFKNPLLTLINVPNLQTAYGLLIAASTDYALRTVNLPSLTNIDFQMDIGDELDTFCPITSINLPVLSNCGNISSGFLRIIKTQITSIDLSALLTVETVGVKNNLLLTSILLNPNLNSIVRDFSGNALSVSYIDSILIDADNSGISYFHIEYNSLVGTFVIGETVTGGTSGATGVITLLDTGDIFVNNVLGVFQISETITGGTSGATANIVGLEQAQILLSGGTNAAPSASGLAAKSSLVSKGWQVTNN